MRKVLGGIFLLGMIAIGGIYWYYKETGIKKTHYNQILEIKREVSLKESLSSLERSDEFFFKAYLKMRDGGRGIKAGYYKLEGEYTIKELISLLEEGRDKVVRFTIPEGTHLDEILNQLEASGFGKKEEFEMEFEEMEFPYPTPGGNFEGYLYPETYFIPEGAPEKRIIGIFLDEFLKKFPSNEYEDKEKLSDAHIGFCNRKRSSGMGGEENYIFSVSQQTEEEYEAGVGCYSKLYIWL